MIFVRAEIMRDTTDTSFQTNQKYNSIRDAQKLNRDSSVQLMPGMARPMIPPLPDSQPQPADTDTDTNTDMDKDTSDDGS
jgi:hypothetical protein